MDARLSSSKKWTPLPEELVEQIEAIFSENFSDAGGHFAVEGRIYPEELLVRFGHLVPGRLRQDNFELSIEYNPNTQNVMQLVNLCVDTAASFMAQLFSKEEIDFPREWKDFAVEKFLVFVRYSTINSQLESAADELLAEADGKKLEPALVEGEDSEEELKAKISLLGLDEEEN